MQQKQSLVGSANLFQDIRKTCKGMLRHNVYGEVHEVARAMPDGNVVEVGTAHGAATIAAALALKDSASDRKVYTIERATGGSRAKFGSADENVAIIKRNFERYGVEHWITLIVSDASQAASMVPPKEPIGLLMLDADGRIDRDFQNFYNMIPAGAPIIIDDYEDRVALQLPRTDRCNIDLKSILTFRLANYFKDAGYIENFRVINQTLFCRKPDNITYPVEFDRQAILEIYRSIIFTSQRLDWRGAKLLIGPVIGKVKRLFPL